ncbi:hypothetical protein H6801_03590 [Candidatus Nomurabacteria bacterium]|nr:hypothetical protein [Candidatus Nomurabacteria bacterium]
MAEEYQTIYAELITVLGGITTVFPLQRMRFKKKPKSSNSKIERVTLRMLDWNIRALTDEQLASGQLHARSLKQIDK